MVRRRQINGVFIDYTPEEEAAADAAAQAEATRPRTRDELKAARQAAVDSIKVTVTSGKIFDGDETSQTRMSRAIIGLQAAGVSSIDWTLGDNTSTLVTLAELTEALILAGRRQAELWPLPA